MIDKQVLQPVKYVKDNVLQGICEKMLDVKIGKLEIEEGELR